MKRSLIFLLWFISISGVLAISTKPENSLLNLDSKGFDILKANSIVPQAPKNDIALVAALDGTIYFVEASSRKILWSFASGSSIYSSYQAFLDGDNDKQLSTDFFIDCGDDWELYRHNISFGKREKLLLTPEKYVEGAPYVSKDGVTVGSKKTTVFLVDAKSGTIITTFRSDASPLIGGFQGDEENPILSREEIEELIEPGDVDLQKVELPLYIMRTDYVLQHFSPTSGKVLWNVKFADIEAVFRCPGTEIGSEYMSDIESPLHCQTRASVYRIREPSLLDSFPMHDRLPKTLPAVEVLSLPASEPRSHSLLDSFPMHDRLPKTLPAVEVLSLPASEPKSLSQPVGRLPGPHHLGQGKPLLALPLSEGTLSVHGGDASEMDIMSIVSDNIEKLGIWVAPLLFIVGFIIYQFFAVREPGKSKPEDSKVQGISPKKKKARKSVINKNNASNEKRHGNISYESKVADNNGLSQVERNETKLELNSNSLADVHVGERKIGKMLVSKKEIAKGSNGTIVLEGIYDGRPVAVKRLVRTHHDVALKEIQNLIVSDQHPNIVRWHGVEYDQDFVYLSLERCNCSLSDLIYLCSDSQDQVVNQDWDSNILNEYIVRLHSIMDPNKDFELWKTNGYPSPQLLKLMRDVVSGLAHLHELGIIHRDLKPQNILIIIKGKSLSAKLSDMGISKRLLGDMSSLTHHGTGYGSSGWQAPEQLRHGRQTRAVDLFSLGCVLFFCLTGGKHPYGDNFERDVNIVNNRKDLFLIENIPEAVDLFSLLLEPDPDLRPKAMDVLHHPFFWSSEMRLSFLRDVSDRVELEDRENESQLLKELESIGTLALNGKWDEKMEGAFINNIGRYRRYKFDSVRDLLRVIRNKLNHYRELPSDIQEILGPVPEGFNLYFSSRFPRFLIEVYKVIHTHCREEEFFQKYIQRNLI
ncbi:serine/threonine-protein kinase/endoribonuclease IRE1b-like isoform X2 [Vitis riparia]|uniref:serine/threonine-protein kinase/endoribonuclease IRE1b-like isoform X2 n=1 Tax=Vitis riparia TaxID=96939 RepID=UPI00155A2524|nr:serine/threonine-protein kinase/endoribonuclease IRE1b-like isoform X2 [Vitis riparia]